MVIQEKKERGRGGEGREGEEGRKSVDTKNPKKFPVLGKGPVQVQGELESASSG